MNAPASDRTTPSKESTSRRRLLAIPLAILAVCLVCGACVYSRYVDWPATEDADTVRAYLPEPYPVGDAHHYLYRNFMDSWDLYRFETTPEGAAHLAASLNLSSEGMVANFPMILSKPPPYWWDPELLDAAELFRSAGRASDGRIYELLYSAEGGTAYMIRFDG